jgi:hypothetical protein
MPVPSEVQQHAHYSVGEVVHWRGSNYRVIARYYRRSMNMVVYDLEEESGNSRTARFQRKIREKEIAPV